MPKMGTKKKSAAPRVLRRIGLADALFSNTQQRVLAALFGRPERSFFLNELVRLGGGASGAVRRELDRLEATGLVTAIRSGRQKHYQANPASPLFDELSSIARKTVGLVDPLRAALAPLAPKIAAAFIFGSFAKREDRAASDIDVMVVGDGVEDADVYAALEPLHGRLGREISPTFYTRADLAKYRAEGNAFVTRVLAGPKIWLIGTDDALAAR